MRREKRAQQRRLVALQGDEKKWCHKWCPTGNGTLKRADQQI